MGDIKSSNPREPAEATVYRPIRKSGRGRVCRQHSHENRS